MRRIWAWLRDRIEVEILAAMGFIAGAVWVFAGLADGVTEGTAPAFDRAVLLALRNPADPADPLGPPWLELMMRDLTALGGVAVLGLITISVSGLLWLQGRRRAVALLLAAIGGGQLFSSIAKWIIDRPRPDIVPHETLVTSASFPSGHSMMATITYLTLAVMVARLQTRRSLRLYLVGMAVLASFLVGASRVYLGVHWPSDVLAGWAAGAGWALGCLLLADWLFPDSKPEQARGALRSGRGRETGPSHRFRDGRRNGL